MGRRLTKIYTRTGTTAAPASATAASAWQGRAARGRVRHVDEANSAIGLLLACNDVPDAVRALLVSISTACSTSAASCASPAMRQ
jgi:cob(I)alamin adenosyltransferase